MISKKVTRHFCEHCNREHKRPKQCADHELRCFKNPKREPWPGELTSMAQTGKVCDFGSSPFGGNGPPGMSWFEWVEHDSMPPWFPGPGKIWTGEDWIDLPHYRYLNEQPHPNGCAGGGPPVDIWPVYRGPKGTLTSIKDVLPAAWRLEHLEDLQPAPDISASDPAEALA